MPRLAGQGTQVILMDWLSGSGGTGKTPSQLWHTSGKMSLRRAAEPLSDWSRCEAVIYGATY